MRKIALLPVLAVLADSACAMTQSHPASPAAEVALCYVENGALVQVRGQVDATSGDTTLLGRPLRAVYQDAESPFTIGKAWFTSHRPIEYRGRTYYKNFPPRQFDVGELSVLGEADHTPLFIEAGSPATDPSIIYVLISADCAFQAYFYTT